MIEADLALHALSPWLLEADSAICGSVSDGESEWLPAKQIADNRYQVCCVPFRAFDLDQGDIVECDEQNHVRRLISKSGNVGFRFTNSLSDEDTRRLLDGLKAKGCAIESASNGSLIAISAPEQAAQEVADLLMALENNGRLEYETIRTAEPAEYAISTRPHSK